MAVIPMLALFAPAFVVAWLAGRRLAFHARRLRMPVSALLTAFFRDVLGTAFIWVVFLVIAVAILTFITRSGQAPFWLLLAPWAFAAGGVRGLVRWNRKIAAFETGSAAPAQAP